MTDDAAYNCDTRMARIVALLIVKDRTQPELVRLLEVRRQAIARSLRALLVEGLVEREQRSAVAFAKGRAASVWKWVGHAR